MANTSTIYTLFVSGIKDKFDEDELKNIFNKHGRVLDVRMRRNFAFIDYPAKGSADMAIQLEDGKEYNGQTIGVQYSKQKTSVPVELTPSTSFFEKKSQENGSFGSNQPPNPYQPSSSSTSNPIDNLFPQVRALAERSKMGMHSDERRGMPSLGPPGPMSRGNDNTMNNFNNPSKRPRFDQGSPSYQEDQWNRGRTNPLPPFQVGLPPPPMDVSMQRPAPSYQDDVPPPRDVSRQRPAPSYQDDVPPPRDVARQRPAPSYQDDVPPPMDVSKQRPNDCEIIAMSKSLRSYAESLEARLKDLGVRVDILFPNDLSAMPLIIDDLTSRGITYAMSISGEDRVTDSVTVTYLQTRPQKKMRMFANDAVALVKCSISGGAEKPKEKPKSSSTGSVPEEVTMALSILLEGRPLSIAEYDRVLDYLSEKREDLAKKMGAPLRAPSTEKPALTKEAIYQNVLTILKDKASSGSSAPVDHQDLSDLNSPIMKKALENLLANKNALSMLHTYSSRMLKK